MGVVLDAKSGDVITTNGRGGISSDQFMEKFPYFPALVDDVNENFEGVQDTTCLIFVQDGLSNADQDANLATLTSVKKDKANGSIETFKTGNKCVDMLKMVKKDTGFGEEPTDKPTFMVVDLSEMKYYKRECPNAVVTYDEVANFCQDFTDGKIDEIVLKIGG